MPKKRPQTQRTLSTTLYCYVEERNARHAKTAGKKLFGSFSGYVNALIARDRGAKPALGSWKARGEADAVRRVTRAKKKSGGRAKGESKARKKKIAPRANIRAALKARHGRSRAKIKRIRITRPVRRVLAPKAKRYTGARRTPRTGRSLRAN